MQYLVEGYILHSRPYRETSAIVTAFTQELGKVAFVAKGIRSKNQKNTGLTQPFVSLQLKLMGNSELKSSLQVEMLSAGVELQGKHLFSGLYINELLMRLLPIELAYPTLFQCYQEALSNLSKAAPLEPILRRFEFSLLTELGYGIELNYEQETGNAIAPTEFYVFHPDSGLRESCSTTDKYRLSGQVLMDISEQKWHPQSLSAAKRISRIALSPLLGKKPLKSRELFR